MVYSKVDSDRFGFSIFRSNAATIDVTTLNAALNSHKPDILILRVPTSEQANIHQLGALNCSYLVADILVEYVVKTRPAKGTDAPSPEGVIYRKATVDDASDLEQMIEVLFSNYNNHYASNPYLNTRSMIDGYKQWTVKTVTEGTGITWLSIKNDKKAAFHSFDINAEFTANAGLGGVLPEFEGEGVYLDFLKKCPILLHNEGVKKVFTSTQIQNLTVQRYWQMAGWKQTSSVFTLHIMPFYNQALKGSLRLSDWEDVHKVAGSYLSETDHMQANNLQTGIATNAQYKVFTSAPIPSVRDHSAVTAHIICSIEDNVLASYYTQNTFNQQLKSAL